MIDGKPKIIDDLAATGPTAAELQQAAANLPFVTLRPPRTLIKAERVGGDVLNLLAQPIEWGDGGALRPLEKL